MFWPALWLLQCSAVKRRPSAVANLHQLAAAALTPLVRRFRLVVVVAKLLLVVAVAQP